MNAPASAASQTPPASPAPPTNPTPPTSQTPPYLDPSLPIPARVADILSRMTPEEKVGQMLQLPAREGVSRIVHDLHIGSILHASPSQLAQAAAEVARTPLRIPLLVGEDCIHGHSFYEGATIFPTQLGLSQTWNPALAEQMARATAVEVAATGIHWTFSPVLCIARDTRWGRVSETCGEDPWLIGEFASAMVRGYQGAGLDDPTAILASAKHFAGYSETQGGRDASEADISRRKLQAWFLPPFERVAREGCATFMLGYQSMDGVPITLNRWLLNEVLRGQWGYRGLLITDWDNVGRMVWEQRIRPDYAAAAADAVQAGNDMIMSTPGFYDGALAALAAGRLDQASVDAAVERILRLKFALGLFENPRLPDPDRIAAMVGAPDHAALNLTIARASLVLLRNNGVLPLLGGLPAADDDAESGGSADPSGLPLASSPDSLQPLSHVSPQPSLPLSSQPSSHLSSQPSSPPSPQPSSHLSPQPLSPPSPQPSSHLSPQPASSGLAPDAKVVSADSRFGRIGRAAAPPGAEHKTIAVVGPNADDPDVILGDWAGASGQAEWMSGGHPRQMIQTVLDGMRAVVPTQWTVLYTPGAEILTLAPNPAGPFFPDGQPRPDIVVPARPDPALIDQAVAAASAADWVVACVGDRIELIGEGRSTATLELIGGQVALLDALAATGKPLIVVVISAKPMVLPDSALGAAAIIYAANPGMRGGQAIAELICGMVEPSGRLTASWPRHAGQLPIYYNQIRGQHGDRYADLAQDPAFAFGEGLPYSSVEYSDLAIETPELRADQTIRANVRLTNTGTRPALETVQVYISDIVTSVTWADRELKGFVQVDLAPRESRVVALELPAATCTIVDADTVRRVEPGDFDLLVGPNSRPESLLRARFAIVG